MTEPTLLPCPFCDDKLAHIWSPAQGGYSVICGNGCGAEGPVMENEERAAEVWNKRTPAPGVTEEEREAIECADTALQEVGHRLIYKDGRTYSQLEMEGHAATLRALATRGRP